MNTRMLADAVWECASFAPDQCGTPEELHVAAVDWLQTAVPGTAAGALRDAGRWAWGIDDEDSLDGRDWWFRCQFEASETTGPWELLLGGLATIADVWLNGSHLLHSDNMFLSHRVPVEHLERVNEIAMRFAALAPLLARRHPRPRWKSLPVRSQSLRWYRTSFHGRLPDFSRWAAPVGPWGAVELRKVDSEPAILERQLDCRCDGEAGVVTINALVRTGGSRPTRAALRVGSELSPLTLEPEGTLTRAHGSVTLARVDRWWPHTHGEQPLYPVSLEFDGASIPLGKVGFRTLGLDQSDGAFTLRVNDVPIFCRGASWAGRDPVTFAAAPEDVLKTVLLARDAGMNMFRIPGYSCYAGEALWNACDEAGILVWQDCMFSTVDPPDDPAFAAGVEQELRQVLGGLQGRPALAVMCGGTEMYQQAAMFGLPIDSWYSPILEETIPSVVADLVPGVPYLPSTPFGGDLPFSPDAGSAHYFGVGGLMRPLDDARLVGIRFAAECLAFGTPPDSETVDEVFGNARAAGHEARWKSTVMRDPGMSWDYEEAGTFYVHELFGLDPLTVRYSDPERALDLTRAAISEAMTIVLSDWRRRSSPCDGALILCLQDSWPGAGWGLIDSLGRPKAPWFSVARVFAPRTLLFTDDGLSGLHLHVFNDRPAPFSGRVRLATFDAAGELRDSAAQEVVVGAHDELQISAQRMFGGFRDLTNAYRFAPVSSDVVLAELDDDQGNTIVDAIHLPAGPTRPLLPDVGLETSLERINEDSWSLRVSSRLFAQYVALDLPGFESSDSWFHIAPGQTRTVVLQARDPERVPTGTIRALNAIARARVMKVTTG